jgi:hypothetical protein
MNELSIRGVLNSTEIEIVGKVTEMVYSFRDNPTDGHLPRCKIYICNIINWSWRNEFNAPGCL